MRGPSRGPIGHDDARTGAASGLPHPQHGLLHPHLERSSGCAATEAQRLASASTHATQRRPARLAPAPLLVRPGSLLRSAGSSWGTRSGPPFDHPGSAVVLTTISTRRFLALLEPEFGATACTGRDRRRRSVHRRRAPRSRSTRARPSRARWRSRFDLNFDFEIGSLSVCPSMWKRAEAGNSTSGGSPRPSARCGPAWRGWPCPRRSSPRPEPR